MAEITYRDAIAQALREELRGDDRVFLMGEDIGRYGGSYVVTKGFLDEFGEERVKDTPEQSTLSEAERKRNLRRAFVVTGALPASVAIIDDVITTGSTVHALAGVLRQAGVRDIRIWAVAKTRHGPPG